MPSLEHTTERLPTRGPDPSSDESPYALLVIVGERTSTYPLPKQGRVVIGRSSQADIRIDHASVSREHAALLVSPALGVEDLGSSNGTRVRGVQAVQGEPISLTPGEVIDLGEVLLVVQHRRLERGLTRICAPAYLEARRDEALEAESQSVFVIRVSVSAKTSASALEVLVASVLEEGELVSSREPRVVDVLLRGDSEKVRESKIRIIHDLLEERGLGPVAQRTWLESEAPTTRGSRGRQIHVELPGAAPARDPAMQTVFALLTRVAPTDLSVVLLGETGVGKELCAEYLCQASPRRDRKFLPLNCAALTESLLESELFGHERGAFTGAVRERVGLLESAHGGTVFLDEVGDMPLSTQAKLLRVLEAKEVLRIGSTSPRAVDIRIISATNRDLRELITQGLFREDLYYRLNGISVLVPPLRERPLDIEPLAEFFLQKAIGTGGTPRELTASSRAWLRAEKWPGNVRQLKNVIERSLLLADGAKIEARHLSFDLVTMPPGRPLQAGLRDEVKELERTRIEQALRDAQGNQREAARLLGVSRGALLRRLDQLGLRSGSKAD